MLSEQNKIDVRRHLGVPFGGVATTGLTMGIRTLYTAGQLEFYMQNLQPYEECVLNGKPYGAIRVYGTVIAGQTLSVTINGTPVTYTVLPADASNSQPLQAVANGLSNAINLSVNTTGVVAGGFAILATIQPTQVPSFGTITAIPAIGSATFTTTLPVVTGPAGLTLYIAASGSSLPHPQTTFIDGQGVQQSLVGYLNICNYLEENIAVSSPNMAFMSAGGPGVAVFRPYEMKQRIQLYDWWRGQMGNKLSVGKDAWGFRGNSGSNQGGSSA